MNSDFENALKAAARSFDLTCNWKMAQALQIIYREITSGENCTQFHENLYEDARNGIEILRSQVTLRKNFLLKNDHCAMNWNADMLLYVISCLLLVCKMQPHVDALKKQDRARFYTDNELTMAMAAYKTNIPFTAGKSAFDLTTQQLLVCVMMLGTSSTDKIDWCSNDTWHVYETIECRVAHVVVNAIQGASVDLRIPTADNFPACAMMFHLGSITAVCRIHRRAAASLAKLVFNGAETLLAWIEQNIASNTAEQSLVDASARLASTFGAIFKEFEGERQDTALDHACVVNKCSLVDIEFASYCTTMGNVCMSASSSMTALHSQSAISSLSWSQSIKMFDVSKDLHVLKLANFYFSTVMNLHASKPSASWLSLFVMTHKDWVQRIQSLKTLKWHTPLIAHLGVSIGWSVVFWTTDGCIKIQTVTATTVPMNSSSLMICVALWMEKRIQEGCIRPTISYENGNMNIKLKDLYHA